MKKRFLKWRVGSVPTGPYRSFERRSWPSADYKNGEAAVQLYCDDSYDIKLARSGGHAPIKIAIADRSQKPWRWRTLKKRATTLDEAKQLAVAALERYPHFTGGCDAD